MKKKKTFEKKAMVRYTGYNPEQEESSMALPINQQLTKVRIRGFKSIKNQEISFNRVNVLIGSNGAGKSNFISVFAFLEEILKKRLGLYSAQRSAESLLYCGRKHTESISMEFVFGNENSYGFDLVPTDDGRLIFSREYYGYCTTHTAITADVHSESVWEQGVPNNITPYVLPILKKNRDRKSVV